MAPSLFASLTGRARAVLPIVERSVREGLSANSIQTLLRAQGMGIRRQTMLDIVREYKGAEIAAQSHRTMRHDRRPDPDRIPTALGKTLRQYSYNVRVTGIDTQTGESIVGFATVSTNALLTRAEAEAQALGMLSESPAEYGFDVESAQLWGVKQSPTFE